MHKHSYKMKGNISAFCTFTLCILLIRSPKESFYLFKINILLIHAFPKNQTHGCAMAIKPLSDMNTSSSFRMVSAHTVFHAGHVGPQSIICWVCSVTRSFALLPPLFLIAYKGHKYTLVLARLEKQKNPSQFESPGLRCVDMRALVAFHINEIGQHQHFLKQAETLQHKSRFLFHFQKYLKKVRLLAFSRFSV